MQIKVLQGLVTLSFVRNFFLANRRVQNGSFSVGEKSMFIPESNNLNFRAKNQMRLFDDFSNTLDSACGLIFFV